MSKVVSLTGEKIHTGEPNAEVVETLEEWLGMARSGEVIGVALAGRCGDGSSRCSRTGFLCRGVVGRLVSLIQRITKTLDDE